MPRPGWAGAAGTDALDGANESQDSQKILMFYAEQYGVALTSSSPGASYLERSKDSDREEPAARAAAELTPATSPVTAAVALEEQSRPSFSVSSTSAGAKRKRSQPQEAKPTVSAAKVVCESTSPPSLSASTAGAAGPQPGGSSRTAQQRPDVSTTWPTDHHAVNPKQPALSSPYLPDRALHPLAKTNALLNPPSSCPQPARNANMNMDASQSSPTQENAERDYHRHYESNESHAANSLQSAVTDPAGKSQRETEGERTLHGDESGVVNFGTMDYLGGATDTQFTENSSPIAAGPSLSNTRATWRARQSSSQQHSSLQRIEGQTPFKAVALAPETPAPPINPFAGKANFQGQALAASQLFGHTQQLSSAVKAGFSPTSSRPSPNIQAHHVTSPNFAETSPLKQQFNITSPTVGPSSPQGPQSDANRDHGAQETPMPNRWVEDGVITGERHQIIQKPVARYRLEPMDQYEPMKKSQERRLGGEVPCETAPSDDEDSDDDADAIARRKRAAQRKEAAMKKLTDVSLRRTSSRDEVQVPSTTQKERRVQSQDDAKRVTQGEQQPSTQADADHEADISTVADSQELKVPSEGFGKQFEAPSSPTNAAALRQPLDDSSNDAIPDSTEETNRLRHPKTTRTARPINSSSRPADTIPETSSAGQANTAGSGEELKQLPGITEHSQHYASRPKSDAAVSADQALEADDLSPLQPSRRSSRRSRPSAKAILIMSEDNMPASTREEAKDTSGEHTTAGANPDIEGARASKATELNIQSDPSIIPESSPQPPPQSDVYDFPSSPPVTSLRKVSNRRLGDGTPRIRDAGGPTTPVAPSSTAPAVLSETNSTLSSLSATPSLSSSTTPATQDSGEMGAASPAGSENHRRPRPKLPLLSTQLGSARDRSARAAKRSRRSARLDSASTDELAKSPSAMGFENSMAQPQKIGNRTARLGATGLFKNQTQDVNVFSGMAFAVSFQSQKAGESKDGYARRLALSNDIERLIVEAGGRLLANGFDELFDSTALKSVTISPVGEDEEQSHLSLAPASRALGFTALIADGHSRKVKYMQALALGLPCLSDRWVTSCMEKQAVVDWSPYLLCAGQSAFLRDAIRSRYLAPYPATEARLANVIEQRSRLLDGSRVLLVMKRSRKEEAKMPYVFLAHVLGAVLSRAYSTDEVKQMMRQGELLGRPFDCVYVDEETGKDEDLFSANSSNIGGAGSKKRKRAAANTSTTEPAPKRARLLNNELFIQSLILGRMIEEGELDE